MGHKTSLSIIITITLLFSLVPTTPAGSEGGSEVTRGADAFDERNMIYELTESTVDFDIPVVIGGPTDRFWDLATGDFDNDGDDDVVTLSEQRILQTWRNDGKEGGDWSVFTIGNSTYGYEALRVVDINDDGMQDILVLTSRMYIYCNIGTPWEDWPEPEEYITPDGVENLVFDDLDADGDTDVVVTGDINVSLWENLGGEIPEFYQYLVGSLAPDDDPYAMHPQIYDVALGDVDNDGDLDPITMNRVEPEHGYNVSAWLNDGTPFEDETWAYWEIDSLEAADFGGVSGVRSGGRILAADFDMDGNVDIICCDVMAQIEMWRGSGNIDAGFQYYHMAGIGMDVEDWALCDFDLDGDIDIIAYVYVATIQVLENLGSPFTSNGWNEVKIAETDAGVGGDLAITNVDGDEYPDIIAADYQVWETTNKLYSITNNVDDPTPTKNYGDIYAYLGDAPVLDGSISDSDRWHEAPTSVSSADDGDVMVKLKHNGTHIFFLVTWNDPHENDERWAIYFEDDGLEPDGILDGDHEDSKYGHLHPWGENMEFRDARGPSWAIDSTHTQDPVTISGSYINGVWILEGGFELCSGDPEDINVTGNETLGFVFTGARGVYTPSAESAYDPSSGWAELHIVFSDGHSDADGVFDCCDAFPLDPYEWDDNDNDGTGDSADKDDDNDGHADSEDAFPNDPNEWKDTDGDGQGDNDDAFPEDGTEWRDTDGDGVGDNSDAYPKDPTEWVDSDGDGVGDNADPFPTDPLEWADNDGDLLGDNSDDDDDNDGYTDMVENINGTDPWDNSSHPEYIYKDSDPPMTETDSDDDSVPFIDEDETDTEPEIGTEREGESTSTWPLWILMMGGITVVVLLLVVYSFIQRNKGSEY